MDANDDYLIIGSGAGGSAVAYRLVQSGRRVRLLERGMASPSMKVCSMPTQYHAWMSFERLYLAFAVYPLAALILMFAISRRVIWATARSR